ncbi:MAG: DUF1579 domain-containing protein [Phycisphaerae bacterium]
MKLSMTAVWALILPGLLLAEPPATQPAGGMQQMDPETAAMAEAYTKAGAVTEHHAALKPMVGAFRAETKMPLPDGSFVTSQGRCVNTLEFGGRFLKQAYEGEFMGQPFKGLGYTGYNNLTGKYEGIWMDEMSTAVYFSTGTYDEASRTWTFHGEVADPITGKPKAYKHVVTIKDDDHHGFAMYEPGPDGEMVRSFEINYARMPGE